jgi:hypothetical protein
MQTTVVIQGVPFAEIDMHTLPLPGELMQVDKTWYIVKSREFHLTRKDDPPYGMIYKHGCTLYLNDEEFKPTHIITIKELS